MLTMRTIAWLAPVAVVLELAFTSHVFQPRVSMLMGDPFLPSNVLSSPLIVLNNGILPIYDISVSCTGPGTIIEADGRSVFSAISRLHGITQIKQLDGGKAAVAADVCMEPHSQHPTHVEAVVRIDFKPSLLPRAHTAFRVVSNANDMGPPTRLALLGNGAAN
jgi:hypothetical protein